MSARSVNVSRSTFEIPADALIYLHGVAAVESPARNSGGPFSLEEKGIDGKTFVFAWETGGLRYYMSLIRPDAAVLGRGGTLLLSKQDAIRLRGLHESVLNDLRLHGLLVPFEFGTVVRGWKDLQHRLIEQTERNKKALATLAGTRQWTVEVSALDTRFAELQQHDTPEKRRSAERERDSFSAGQHPPKTDVRSLERILTKERRLAETIHNELVPLADHAKVVSMVSVQGGTSTDWKPILKAQYDVRPNILPMLQRKLTDMQYQYVLQELMIALTGDLEKLSLDETR